MIFRYKENNVLITFSVLLMRVSKSDFDKRKSYAMCALYLIKVANLLQNN